jgi:hypothetical protein
MAGAPCCFARRDLATLSVITGGARHAKIAGRHGRGDPLSMSHDSTSEAGRAARAKAAGRLGRRTHELTMNRRTVILGLVSVVATGPSCSHAQSPPRDAPQRVAWKEIPKIVILSAEDDSRIPAVREAIDFWNAELSQLGSAFRLGTTSHSLRTISTDDLRAYIATPRVLNSSLLNSVREANGDVIIALSEEAGFNPFTSRWPAVGRVLVAIPNFRKYSRTLPGLARNVVAHELGHVVGLGHNDDVGSLMCGDGAPCPLKVGDRFFPLTIAEKVKLLEMYPPDWQPVPTRRWKADPPTPPAG